MVVSKRLAISKRKRDKLFPRTAAISSLSSSWSAGDWWVDGVLSNLNRRIFEHLLHLRFNLSEKSRHKTHGIGFRQLDMSRRTTTGYEIQRTNTNDECYHEARLPFDGQLHRQACGGARERVPYQDEALQESEELTSTE